MEKKLLPALQVHFARHQNHVFANTNLNSALSFYIVTAHAHKKCLCNVSICVPDRSSAAVLWQPVVQMIWAKLVKSPLICLSAILCSHSLIILLCQGFYIFYKCSLNVSLHLIIISIHFPLIYAIWWPLTHSAQSYFYMNWLYRRAFSFSTHTLKHAWRLNEDINTRTTSPELLWDSLHEFFTI